MSGLKHTMAAVPAGDTRRTYGTAYWDGSRWWANVGGNMLDARWLDPIQPQQSGKIVVDITNDGKGQSTALVIGGYTDQPRPSTGTVTAVETAGSATEVVFTGDDGVSYRSPRFTGSYNLGDSVLLDWTAGMASVTGHIPGITVVHSSPPPLPPTAAFSGEVSAVATVSDTFGVGGWGRWAGSQNGRQAVYSGTWGGYTVTGAWFYGAPKPVLSGKTITRIRFKLPARLSVGASGTATVHLYAHTSQSRPGADVTRSVGPFDYQVGQGAGGQYIDLPLSFAATLAAGGGVSIAGDPYVGFKSRLDDPEAGKLIFNWSA